jgi:hypothetical protein
MLPAAIGASGHAFADNGELLPEPSKGYWPFVPGPARSGSTIVAFQPRCANDGASRRQHRTSSLAGADWSSLRAPLRVVAWMLLLLVGLAAPDVAPLAGGVGATTS